MAEVSETKQGVKIKLHDKLEALDKMAKIVGAYKEPEHRDDIRITSVTYVLNHGNGEVDHQTRTIDGAYEVLLEDGDDALEGGN